MRRMITTKQVETLTKEIEDLAEEIEGLAGGSEVDKIFEIKHYTPDGSNIMEGIVSCSMLNEQIYRIAQCTFNFIDEEDNIYLTNGKIYVRSHNFFDLYGMAETLDNNNIFKTNFTGKAQIPMAPEIATQ